MSEFFPSKQDIVILVKPELSWEWELLLNPTGDRIPQGCA
jgi:hypothetical protein